MDGAGRNRDVASLVTRRLLTIKGESLPDPLRHALTGFGQRQQATAERLARDLARLLQAMQSAGIPVIPVKGPILASQAYGDPALRPARDLDILVQDADIDRTLEVLLQVGYHHDPALEPGHRALLRTYAGQYVLFHPAHTPVEPHWRLAPQTLAFGLDHAALWRNATSASFRGFPCLKLQAEDALLVLCLHGAKDRWRQLKLVADIAFFLHAHPQLDWTSLQAAAAAQGCRRILGLALLLAARLLDAPVPEPVLRAIANDRAIERLARIAAAALENPAARHEGPYCLNREYWLMHERRSDRWAYALRTSLMPRPAHYRRLKLPASLAWAYRPLKLPWDYALTPALAAARRVAEVAAGAKL